MSYNACSRKKWSGSQGLLLGGRHCRVDKVQKLRACSSPLTRVGGTLGSPAARRLSLVPLQVDSKATLGLGGVAVVLGAVLASMGFFSYLGVPSSLVILQVVPFLVLAVGADNIFIFVLEYQVRGQEFCTPSAAPTHPGMAPWVCWVYFSLFLSTDVHVYNSCRKQGSVFIFHINAFIPHVS